uniref:ANK_REP_REGION domain-containing protein n=2 Tax=Caenorhabditis japonica TaxID=281687 RepID=A0A8R1ECP9_CAEJA
MIPILYLSTFQDGRTALHYAAALYGLRQDPTLYFLLMEKGARDNLLDSEGFTAQDVRNNPGLVDLDKARYANVYPVPRETEWEISFATKTADDFTREVIHGTLDMSSVPNIPEHLELIEKLTLLQSQVLGIWDAVAAEDDRSLKQLICEKHMGMVRDRDGRTPLHHAYIKKRKELISYLLFICPEAADVKDRIIDISSTVTTYTQITVLPYLSTSAKLLKIVVEWRSSRLLEWDTGEMRWMHIVSVY